MSLFLDVNYVLLLELTVKLIDCYKNDRQLAQQDF